MGYSIQTIFSIIGGAFISNDSLTPEIQHLVYDSRRVQQGSSSLFFALITEHNDGHNYVGDAYKKGIRNFVVSKPIDISDLEECTIISVEDTLIALQKLARFHREHFHYPVIGITGSNGKTIIKEWLFQLLQDDYKIVRSPKSYNSQVGVALSVWQMGPQHDLGIFEAGISTVNEMERLKAMIEPTIGILTNIGEAHDAGFITHQQKLEEKWKLFENADVVIGEHTLLGKIQTSKTIFSWGTEAGCRMQVLAIEKSVNNTTIKARYEDEAKVIKIPFTDDASVQNALNCWCTLLYLGLTSEDVSKRFSQLHSVDMRLQLMHGINDCLIVNDSYSADTTSLKIALDFIKQQSSGLTRTLFISDFYESGKPVQHLSDEIAGLIQAYKVNKVYAVGEIGNRLSQLLKEIIVHHYTTTEELILNFKSSTFYKEIILIKGARKFEFELVARLFEKKLHQTVLEINLNALVHNLKEYQKLLKPSTKIMAMVKAFSYGSGGAEIASVLQYHNIHYLGVAYADEGVELIKSGISLPIMVMNAEESSFRSIVDYNLQPVIYSLSLLDTFQAYLIEQGLDSYPVHIEIETGMNRLGFGISEVEKLCTRLSNNSHLSVQSVFSHLAASEDPSSDQFTKHQALIFEQAVEMMKKHIPYPFLKHISNSAAIVRHPYLQMDMVRLGIGLYGIEVDGEQKLRLQPVATLRSTIAQLRKISKGSSVSYNRRGVVARDSLIATVRIGYADGYSRQFGNGVGKMWVKGQLAPVIGSVCMDMTMIDVTGIEGINEGDDVVLYGTELPLEEVAGWIKTIPYEIMTSVSHRVKRIYFHE